MSFKLLHLDIETSPIVAYLWDLYKPLVGIDQIITPTSILCVAVKWHGKAEVIFHKAPTRTAFDRMIKAVHRLLNEADAVCHYNGISFDMPRLNREFLRLGLPPTPSVPQIDLLKVIRDKFSMDSNKLAFVGPYLKVGEKVENSGWKLWKGCLAGDKQAWADMEKYNKQDVVLLEKLYNKVLPWIDQHPNMNLYISGDETVCPNCGNDSLQRRGVQRALTLTYRRLQCTSCGKWCRERFSNKLEPTAKVR